MSEGVWAWVEGFGVLLTVITVLFVVWLAVWLYSVVVKGVCKSKVQMVGKTVIVTGSDTGIGKATALDLAGRGARVVMACINVELAHKVRDLIVKETKNPNVVVKFVDLSSLKSVRIFAEDINSTESRLDVLIHNAGLLVPPRPVSVDGLNMILAVNHFGPFLLNHLLIDLLKKTGKSRIVIVSSSSHKLASAVVDPSIPNPLKENPTKDFNFQMYKMSKFAIVLCTKELARRLHSTDITVNTLHPGLVVTSITIPVSQIVGTVTVILLPFLKSATQGAQTSIYLAVSEDVEGVTGKYFTDCKETAAAERTDDLELAEKYWRVCEGIVQLRPSDPHL